MTQRLNAVAAADGRDALAKAVYAALFDWLVARINASFANTRGAALTTISILDIYGFEFFERNSFEQLCINYANERLQQQFNRHLFKLEQEEYEREKIDWTKVEFEDNQACLDLIERRPMGVLSLLDEQCAFPKATDATFAQKMATELRSDPRYARDKRDELVFHVQHYAGEVNYDATGFLDKNRDALHQDLLAALSESTEPAVSALAAAMSESRDGDVSRAGGLRARAPRQVASPSARGLKVSWRRWWRNWTSVRRISCDASSPTARWRPPRLSRATSCANFDAAASSRWFASADRDTRRDTTRARSPSGSDFSSRRRRPDRTATTPSVSAAPSSNDSAWRRRRTNSASPKCFSARAKSARWKTTERENSTRWNAYSACTAAPSRAPRIAENARRSSCPRRRRARRSSDENTSRRSGATAPPSSRNESSADSPREENLRRIARR